MVVKTFLHTCDLSRNIAPLFYRIRITIGARDQGGDESKVGKTVLEIRVVDVNDNSPFIEIAITVTADGETGRWQLRAMLFF